MIDIGTVSVIIPAYKCEKHIDNCIRSVIGQTYTNLEIIIVLDGVFDSSNAICYKYANMDDRVHVIEREHEGVSVARNVGIEMSHGEWIAFVDSDDWVEPNYIEALVNGTTIDSDIVICDFYAEFATETRQERFFSTGDIIFSSDDKEMLITNCMLPIGIGDTNSCTGVGVPWAKLYRAEFVKDRQLAFKPGLSRMQDMVFNLYAFSMMRKAIYISKPLYHYVRNAESATMSYRQDFFDTVMNINVAVEEFIAQTGLVNIQQVLYAKNILLILEMIRLQFAMNPHSNACEKVRRIRKLLRNPVLQNSIYKYRSELLEPKMKVAGILLKWNCIGIVYAYISYKTNRLLKWQRIENK